MVWAQPPVTYPPAEVPRPSAKKAEPGKLPINGIMTLDPYKNIVYFPGLTYERLDELVNGSKDRTRRYIFDRVVIDGRVEGNRAEMTIEVNIQVDATGDETVEIPLAMENFHRLRPAEFFAGTGPDNKLAVTVDPDSGAHLLVASVAQNTAVGFRMQMSARVETDSVESLDFRLPPSPIEINLLSDSRDVTFTIPNRDDEVTATTVDERTGRSRFHVESSGGRFTMQWGKIDRPVSVPLLESESSVAMQWNSPQDPLIQTVKMTVRDSRGPIPSFKLRLPKGAKLRDEPKLIARGQSSRLVKQVDPDDESLIEITIPKPERGSSIALEFRVEIASDAPSAKKPLAFQVPIVEGALKNRGTVEITTSPDYRLRWNPSLYVNFVASASSDDAGLDQRSYEFQFIRGAFQLPLWLDTTRRELRVTSECDMEVRDDYANLTMQIRPFGSGNRTQFLLVDLADWQTPQIEDATTGAPLTWFEAGEHVEIEINYTGMGEISPVLIKARQQIEIDSEQQTSQPVALEIPHVVVSEDASDPITVQESTVRLSGKGRRSLVVDLAGSRNLERLIGSDTDGTSREFSIVPPESAVTVVGELVLQPPRLILQAFDSSVRLIGDQVDTEMVWTIESKADLEGRLRVAIPAQGEILPRAEEPFDETLADGADSTPSDRLPILSPGQWIAQVNGAPAQLRPVMPTEDLGQTDAAATQFDLVCDQLSVGEMEIRFHKLSPIQPVKDSPEAIAEVEFPYPLVQDITLQAELRVDLRGDETRDITPTQRSLTDQLVFRSLPTEPVSLRISPRMETQSELTHGVIVVRSAINEVSQHDQMIAAVDGIGEFKINLRSPEETDIQVTLDGKSTTYKVVDGQLVVEIPDPSSDHVVDVRMWLDHSDQTIMRSISPLANVGSGLQPMYWQLIVPSDCHLVWATPSVGRAMQWGFDRWRMRRFPLIAESSLLGRVSTIATEKVELSAMPSGNEYLFTSMDDRTFRAITASRTILWIMVAGLIVLITAIATYLPSVRNPISLVVVIAGFAGLLAVAPDAAIMVGQVAMLAIVVVIIMFAIRSLIVPVPSRVLSSTRESRIESNSKIRRAPIEFRSPSSLAVTHSIGPDDIASAVDEVAR